MEQIKGIGQLLWNLREKEGVRQKALCHGLCSHAKYVRVEYDQQEIDFFLIDRLMGRLGKSVERLTYILPMEVYEVYELRQEIQQSICLGKWEDAKRYLEKYQENKKAQEPLHRQFIEQEYAQIAWLQKKTTENVCAHLEKAILQTMPDVTAQRKTGVLSAEEYKLLLFRWEVCQGTAMERPEQELCELTEEIFRKNFEKTERVKVIPYAALLQAKIADGEKQNTYVKMLTEAALDNLREEGKLLYMPEILEQYAQILEKEKGNTELIHLLRQERNSVLELEQDYGVSFENFRLFDHVVRNFEIDAELLRRTRMAANLTQEALSEDICAQETLARIENGNQKPRSRKLSQMMEKMGRNGRRIDAGIQVEEYETLELKIEFSKFIHRREYEKAEKVLGEIEKKIDSNILQNKQYIETEKTKIKNQKKPENTKVIIQQLKELLMLSLKIENGQKVKFVLSTEEISILTEMGLIYWWDTDYQQSLEIYRFINEQYSNSCVKPVFHMLDWAMNTGNYAQALEELGYFQEAENISKKEIQQTLYAGKGCSVPKPLLILACIAEQKKKESCEKYFQQDLNLFRLYKMDSDYRVVKNYIKDRNLLT